MHTKTSVQGVDEVSRWRCEQLVEAGFEPALADSIAKNGRYDLHALIELVDRGYQPNLAVRILAPVEEEKAA
jgi:hypothetical protein